MFGGHCVRWACFAQKLRNNFSMFIEDTLGIKVLSSHFACKNFTVGQNMKWDSLQCPVTLELRAILPSYRTIRVRETAHLSWCLVIYTVPFSRILFWPVSVYIHNYTCAFDLRVVHFLCYVITLCLNSGLLQILYWNHVLLVKYAK